jgi:hypothetical protein
MTVDRIGYETATQFKLPIYLFASAIGEFAATVALCPWEAIRIRSVAGAPSPSSSSGSLFATFSRILQNEGFMNGFYRGIGPILLKQVPYTMTQITGWLPAPPICSCPLFSFSVPLLLLLPLLLPTSLSIVREVA